MGPPLDLCEGGTPTLDLGKDETIVGSGGRSGVVVEPWRRYDGAGCVGERRGRGVGEGRGVGRKSREGGEKVIFY